MLSQNGITTDNRGVDIRFGVTEKFYPSVPSFATALESLFLFGTLKSRPERRVLQHFCPTSLIHFTLISVRIYCLFGECSRGWQWWKTASKRVDCICPTRLDTVSLS